MTNPNPSQTDSSPPLQNSGETTTAGGDIVGRDKHTIHTAGGANIPGTVNTAGGPFAGRDHITHHHYTILHPPSSILFLGVPSLPAHFLGRDDLLADLVNRLCRDTAGLALSAEGLPGVGKTTLAVAVAYHPAILAHFSDGVLWAGLGPRPDPMSLLAGWAAALGHDVSDRLDLPARSQAVKDAIGLRHLLLVIDDAWDLDAATSLRCGGPHCAHLLTSRDQNLARKFAGAGRVIRVPVLEDDPAYTLL
jgi:hypothetical protein